MVYLVIFAFGLGAFIIAYIYQWIFTSKRNIFFKFFSIFFLTLLLMTGAYLRQSQISKSSLESTILSPLASPISQGLATIHYLTKTQGLENQIKPLIQNEQGTYAVGIKNIKTGDEYYLNEDRKFETASLYKLWIMATVYQQIEQGKISLDQTLSEDVPDLNNKFNISSDSAELTTGTITSTVQDALTQMITVSDNYSALLLSSKVLLSTVSQYLTTNGFVNSSIGTPPTSTVTDITAFYEKLYNKKLVSPTTSSQILTLLESQQINDRIPKYLPKNTMIAHKTGELGNVKHDAGIVFSQKGDYIIVLMSETNDSAHATEVEANISKKVWEYFNK